MNTNYVKAIQEVFKYEEFQLITDTIPQGIITLNELGSISFANRLARQICYRPSNTTDIFKLPIDHLAALPEQMYPDMSEIIRDSLAYKRVIARQIQRQKHYYYVESQPVYTSKDAYLGCVISIGDVTRLAANEKQYELLYQTSSALSRVKDIVPSLKTALVKIVDSFGVSSANIMLYSPKEQVLHVNVNTDTMLSPRSARDIRLGEGVAGHCALEKTPYCVYDVSTSALFTQKNPEDRGALLSVPLVNKGELIGVLNVMDNNCRYFTEHEVQFLSIIANEFAVALENGRLYSHLNHKIEQLYRLYEISSFVPNKALDTRIAQVLHSIPPLLEAESACIYTYNFSDNSFEMSHVTSNADWLQTRLLGSEAPNLLSMMTTKETLTIDDAKMRKVAPGSAQSAKHNCLCTPILVSGQAIGILIVFDTKTRKFTQDDKTLLKITAHRFGTKIENAQLLQRVESEKETLDKIIENTSEGVVVVDTNQNILIWNKYIEVLTGINSQDIIGTSAIELFSYLNLSKLAKHIATPHRDTKKRQLFQAEEIMKLNSNQKVWVETVCSEVFDSSQTIETMIIVIRNVSHQKELLEAKDEFISLTTHELRTPITAVKGYLSMILHGDAGELNKLQNAYFSKAYKATERLSSLVEDLLEVFRIGENTLDLHKQACSLNALVEENIEDLAHKAKLRSIRLKFNSVATHTVYVDPIRTKQIIQNLLDNAIKYNRDKGTVTISIEQGTHSTDLLIHDTGIGIPAEYIETVFDRFVRVPNARSVKVGGAGLGLYIVKKLVEHQNGTISVSSPPGKGTCFRVTFPNHRPLSKQTNERTLHAIT